MHEVVSSDVSGGLLVSALRQYAFQNLSVLKLFGGELVDTAVKHFVDVVDLRRPESAI